MLGGLTGPLPRQRQRRHPAVGHLLRRRALPHGDGRGAAAGGVRRASTTGSRRSPAACSTTGSASCTSGSPSSAPTLIYFPMHYLGVLGMPRRYYDYDDYQFIPPSAHPLNVFITVVALIVGAAQLVFVFNLVWSAFRGARGRRQSVARRLARMVHAGHAAGHGNWGAAAAGRATAGPTPTACRARREDFIAQNAPPEAGGAGAASRMKRGRMPTKAAAGVNTAVADAESRMPAATAAPRPRAAASACGCSSASRRTLFSLFLTAYVMRMDGADWSPIALPRQLWLSTRCWWPAACCCSAPATAAERARRRAGRCCWPAARARWPSSSCSAGPGRRCWPPRVVAGRQPGGAASSTC